MSPIFKNLVTKGFESGGHVVRLEVDNEMNEKFSDSLSGLEIHGFSKLTHTKDINQRIKDRPENHTKQKTEEELLEDAEEGFAEVRFQISCAL